MASVAEGEGRGGGVTVRCGPWVTVCVCTHSQVSRMSAVPSTQSPSSSSSSSSPEVSSVQENKGRHQTGQTAAQVIGMYNSHMNTTR